MKNYLPRRKPKLYRLARYLRWSSILAFLIVILFILSVIYSAVLFGEHGSLSVNTKNAFQLQESSPGVYTSVLTLNITNTGIYTLTLDLSASLGVENGPSIGTADTGGVTVPPNGQSTPVVLKFTISDAAISESDGYLLTHGAEILGALWFNATYATVFTFGLAVNANGTWGAPFHGLTVTPGTPSASGGQTTVPFGLNFTDNSPISDGGTLTLQVVNGGSDCGSPATLDLDVDSGQAYNGNSELTGPSSCMTPSASIETTYTDGGLTVALPTESLG